MYTFNCDDLIIQSEPIVIHDEAVVFMRDGKVVGKVKAKYDFSELPGEFHQIALQMIYKSQVVHMPGRPHYTVKLKNETKRKRIPFLGSKCKRERI